MTAAQPTGCFHCGEPVPPGSHFRVEIEGAEQPMCCPGCQAVATMIAGSGLESFYRQRTAYSERPEYTPNISQDDFSIYDSPELANAFCRDTDTGATEAQLLIGGITCAACTWLLETELARVPGVERASVNLQQQRLDVVFRNSELPVSAIFSRVQALGYRPQPFKASTQREQFEWERKQSLRRVAVAGIGMMQVGMFGIALHAGDIQGISNEYQGLLRWVSLLVASFVVWYSARPFFESAWRHLRRGALVMDLPVSLAIGLALLASIWATLSGGGEVYFDSVVMFTFFLLLGRFLEQRVRLRQGMTWVDLEASLPDSVLVQRGGDWQRAVRSTLEPGELVLLRAGDTIAVDARVRDGESLVREDSFNGEQHPRSVSIGDTVYAGTVNIEQNLEAEVLCDFAQSRLATLQRSISQAQVNKPRLAQLADAIASYFVAGVLLVTSITALAWWQIQPDKALWVALSVLVIACPCALALATPAALAGAATGLRRMGIIVRGENSLEALASTTHLLFDKTGTLTRGDLSVGRVQDLAGKPDQDHLALAAALQQFSSHPVAAAFSEISPATGLTDALATAGAGIEANYQGSRLRMGSLAFCKGLQPAMPAPPDEPRYWVGLCSEHEALAWIGLEDSVREEADAVISALRDQGFELELLTGDASEAGPRLAEELGIQRVVHGASPEDKMRHVQALQQSGASVTMVGDGLNDAPVLKVANASFAMPGATDLARSQADLVIADGNLWQVPAGLAQARQCRRIIKQNFAWALGYNLSGIPLAAMGFIPPWAAAIGMSLSSLLVVINSLRLSRRPQR